MTARVISIGTATLDRIWRVEITPAVGSKIRAYDYLEVGGGQAANAAVAMVRLGGAAELWSAVGDDTAGADILAGLMLEGVGIDQVVRVPTARSVTSAVIVERSGERTIVADVDARLHADAPAFDLASVTTARALLSDTKWPEAQVPALSAARAAGVPTVLDVEPAPAGFHEQVVPLGDHVVFGRAGLAVYSGTDDVVEGLRLARRRTGAVVGVTLGGEGALFATNAGEIAIPALSVNVVDTTGAGDAFHGAYALAIAEGRSVVDAARLASVVAALKCARPGGRAGLPTRAEAISAMETLR